METQLSEPAAPPTPAIDPEREAVMADAVGVALLVVLDRLNPAERLAFVLHDLFAVSFEEIGNILGKSTMATRQLASRARRRVQGAPADPEVEVRGKRKLISSFLNALRAGDVPALVAVLDPEFVIHIDKFSTPDGEPRVIHGPETWAQPGGHLLEGREVCAAGLGGWRSWNSVRSSRPPHAGSAAHLRGRQDRCHRDHRRSGAAERDGPCRLPRVKRKMFSRDRSPEGALCAGTSKPYSTSILP